MYPPLFICLLYLLPVYCHWHHHRHDPNPFRNNHNYHHHHKFSHDPNFHHTPEFHQGQGFPHDPSFHRNHGFPPNNPNFQHSPEFHRNHGLSPLDPNFPHTFEYHRVHGFIHPWHTQAPPPITPVFVPPSPPTLPPTTTQPPTTQPPTTQPPITQPPTTQPPTTSQPPTTTQPPDPIDELLCDLEDLYEDLQYYCHNTTKELASGGLYHISAPLQAYQEESIEIKIKYRVMSISAASANGDSYKELVLLPAVVDNQNAVWEYDGQDLDIYFSKISELNTCVGLSDVTITVPQNPSLDYFSS